MTFEQVHNILSSFPAGGKTSEGYLRKNWKDITEFIDSYSPFLHLSFKAKTALIRWNHKEIPLCSVCRKPLVTEETSSSWFSVGEKHQRKQCSVLCARRIPENIKKVAEFNRGRPGTMLGKHLTEEQKKKCSEAQKLRFQKMPGTRYNKPHSMETKEKISKKVRERFQQNPEKYKEDCRKGYLNGMVSRNGSSVNKKSLPYLEEIEKWLGCSALYGEKEKRFKIGKKSYWVDFYCEDLKLIIEWDEPRHNWTDYKAHDEEKQKAITNYLGESEWIFFRIKEKEYLNLSYENKQHYIRGGTGREYKSN